MNQPTLGVVLVTFNSTDVIFDCLETLIAAPGVRLHVVVVDNASTDGTPEAIEDWAAGRVPYAPPGDIPFPLKPAAKPLTVVSGTQPVPEAPAIKLVLSPVNRGFAGGVNLGLAELARVPGVDRFWVLNPDSVVPPDTPRAFAEHPAPPGGFALMGGRVTYLEQPDRIQIDGGTIDRRTGVTGNIGLGQSFRATPPPRAESLDFVTGASMVASRAFYESAGPMAEDYFLYYEEVDWALRRGSLPLAVCPEARVYHRAGTAIGSPAPGRMASPFSFYFKHRGRMMFMRRHFPRAMPTAWAYSLAKAAQLLAKGHAPQARALLAGCRNGAPPAEVVARLSPESIALFTGAAANGSAARPAGARRSAG
jgi:hypothetical protein